MDNALLLRKGQSARTRGKKKAWLAMLVLEDRVEQIAQSFPKKRPPGLAPAGGTEGRSNKHDSGRHSTAGAALASERRRLLITSLLRAAMALRSEDGTLRGSCRRTDGVGDARRPPPPQASEIYFLRLTDNRLD
jgi:hypothetical protein